MDQIKNALSGHSGSSQQSSNQESGQKQDYGDKGKHPRSWFPRPSPKTSES